MIYKSFQDKELSALGMGAMRLPTVDGNPMSEIDEAQVEEMVAYAMEQGINYYDTAYGYHDGKSEVVMGKVLAKYPREKFYLADKFPGYDLSNMDKVEAIFEEQLQKTGMEYFDFYLFHNVCELNVEQYLDPKYGIMDYLWKQKENGRIKHLGFSAHARVDVMKKFLEKYGDRMEFCQIQLNYLDWTLQEAKEKVDLLNEKNIPIWVMEPLRGGKLASLTDEQTADFKKLRPDETAAAWAFRYLQGIEGVTVTLSGMSSLAQLKENIETFQTEKPLNDEEQAAVQKVTDSMLDILPCTSCRYCTSHCPKKLDIPNLLFMYNELKFNNGFITQMGIGAMKEEERPSACVGCRSCEAVCPQTIKISEVMKDFVERMNQPVQW
ncbi:MAG: aldo/keto reductase [Lachnospiraceae bacterium]|nr:aldo/keto reductase [Lachnospiraceae bacterium]